MGLWTRRPIKILFNIILGLEDRRFCNHCSEVIQGVYGPDGPYTRFYNGFGSGLLELIFRFQKAPTSPMQYLGRTRYRMDQSL